MATEQRERRGRGLAWGLALAAALLLITAALPLRRPHSPLAGASPELVELTLLAGAREKGAVCLDGSSPGYHLQRGSGSGSHSWLIYLQGGAWCNTVESCFRRSMSDFGSSDFMEAVQFTGMLSNEQLINTDFYNWNRVVIRYCDGASFSGDAQAQDQNGAKLFFRGLRIWEAVIDELMEKGLANAKQAFLTGCSAGGLATLLHCDGFRQRFPQDVSVKCLSDAGFFLDFKDLSGQRSMWSFYNGVVHLQNVRKVLPKNCLEKKDPTECFFPAELVKSINTPTFILNSGYDSWQIQNVVAPDESCPGQSWLSCKADIRNCDSSQIEVLHGFRTKLVKDLKVVEDKEGWGWFIDSCFTHCQTADGTLWNSGTSPRVGNKTVSEAVGDWYFGRRSEGVKETDCEYYPCNPTCSTTTMSSSS